MTTARAVIEDALTFRLNRLSPGEAVDADTLSVCLRALNSIADEWNGAKAFLFREVLTASGSAISAATALLGTAWAALSPGDMILGATYSDGTQDIVIGEWTMQRYHEEALKTQTGPPEYFAHDGLATVYFWPVPTGQTITLRTKAVVADFAAVDTDYSMPKGYKSALTDVLAERLAPTMGGLTPPIKQAASAARLRILGQTVSPAILNQGSGPYNIQRGY